MKAVKKVKTLIKPDCSSAQTEIYSQDSQTIPDISPQFGGQSATPFGHTELPEGFLKLFNEVCWKGETSVESTNCSERNRPEESIPRRGLLSPHGTFPLASRLTFLPHQLRTCLLSEPLLVLTSSSLPSSPSTFHHFLSCLLLTSQITPFVPQLRLNCGFHPSGSRFSGHRTAPACRTKITTEELSLRKMLKEKSVFRPAPVGTLRSRGKHSAGSEREHRGSGACLAFTGLTRFRSGHPIGSPNTTRSNS